MLRATTGAIPERAQDGLKDTLKSQRYFLACSCYPTEDLAVAAPGDEQRIPATISSLQLLTDSVLRVGVTPASALEYEPGQFITIVRQDGLARSYSIASLPTEKELELHVRRVPNGAMSGWLFGGEAQNAQIKVQGPAGTCFYVAGRPEQPIVCVGAGTGLAPLYGIVREALTKGHTGPIWLFHAALNPAGLYRVSELQELERRHSNFRYFASVLRSDGAETSAKVGPADEFVLSSIPDLNRWRGYICGDPAFVANMKMQLFLGGMASSAIYSDAFIPSATS
jgi:NAD(P)H-flavin reductase